MAVADEEGTSMVRAPKICVLFMQVPPPPPPTSPGSLFQRPTSMAC